MPSLLMGCGHSRSKKVSIRDEKDWNPPLTTMDMNPNCGADIVGSLEDYPLPFKDNEFDEIAAYDVLEHLGRQGDWKGFFDEFAEYWRILKPGGTFGISVPIGDDFLADPGHTRFFSVSYFRYLDQDWYAGKEEAGDSFNDYRWYWNRHFKTLVTRKVGDHHLIIVLEAVK